MNAPAKLPANLTSAKLVRIGNSTGVVFPRELLARLRVGHGDTVYFSEAPDGLRVTATDPAFERKMTAAEQVMREDRDILRVLAQ
jgi:putative addiction module antidote